MNAFGFLKSFFKITHMLQLDTENKKTKVG